MKAKINKGRVVNWFDTTGNIVPIPTSVAISSSQAASNPVVINTSVAHKLAAGDQVTISGHSIAGVNATWTVVAAPTSTSFTVAYNNSAGGAGSGGTAAMTRLTGQILDGATVLATLTWAQNATVPNLFQSQEVTITKVGNFTLLVKYNGVAIDSIPYDVGEHPVTDQTHNVAKSLALSLQDGGASQTISLKVIKADGTSSASISAPYDAAKGAYVAASTYTFATEGPYALVWHKVISSVVTPFLMKDQLVLKVEGKETVVFSVRTLADPAGTPHASVQVVVSRSDGTQEAQGTTGSDGYLVLSLSPGLYKASLLKSGVVFNTGNFSIEVVDTDVEAWTNTVPLTPESFTPTVTAPSAPPSLCSLFLDLYDMVGAPVPHADVLVTTLSPPQMLTAGVADTKRLFKTDSNGHAEFSLVQGLKIELCIAPIGLRRILTVPSSAGPSNLLTLAAAAEDLFDIVVPNLPAAASRTL